MIVRLLIAQAVTLLLLLPVLAMGKRSDED